MSALAGLPPHLRRRLEAALETGLLSGDYTAASLRAALGAGEGLEELRAELAELERLGISGRGAAAWVRALDEVAAKQQPPDLVWSGPAAPGLRTLDTRRAYEELLTTARRTLWLSTFAYFDGPKVFAPLARHMEDTPGLRVTLLLNIQRDRGDGSAPAEAARDFAARFWEEDWPGKARPDVYYDPRSLDPDGPAGVLHAKAAVADRETVLVTSANLTDAALDRNIELGILVRDPGLAASVATHFQGLVTAGLLAPLDRP